MNLGQIGIWQLRHRGTDGVAEIEQLGHTTLSVGGSPSTGDARPYLEATSAITIDFPGRFLLGTARRIGRDYKALAGALL